MSSACYEAAAGAGNDVGVRQWAAAFVRRSVVLYYPAKAAHLILIKGQRAYWVMRRPNQIKEYLASHRMRKLNIGSGTNLLAGWINTDLFPRNTPRPVLLDATEPLPLPDNSFDYVFTEHMIEHLTFEQGLALLRECYRILKPGAKIRVATPDLRMLFDLCRETRTDLQERYIRWSVENFIPGAGMYHEAFVINNFFRNWGHQFIYDEATLRASLERAGFVDVVRREPGESEDENLRGIESHGKTLGSEEMNRLETMALEARRPG